MMIRIVATDEMMGGHGTTPKHRRRHWTLLSARMGRLAMCVRIAWCLALLTAAPSQTALAQNGALFLLLPFGAKASGQGEAVVADSTLGMESIWWNAAGLARLSKSEIALNHSASLLATTDMAAYVRPSKVLGTLAAAAYMADYGDQDATDLSGTKIGTISNRNYLLAFSYASPMGKRLSAGITYKFVMLRVACAGSCGDQPVLSGSSNALDLGAQYRLPTSTPVMLGVSVRNIGPSFQVKDAEQADPLPKLVQVGVRAQLPIEVLRTYKSSLDVSLDVTNASALGGTAANVGTQLTYDTHVFLRAGYDKRPAQTGVASLGFGYAWRAGAIDVSQRFDPLLSQGSTPPLFVSLRYLF